jgi:hypothetical protein
VPKRSEASLYAIDPDFRKEPKTETFCIVCQRDLKCIDTATRVRTRETRIKNGDKDGDDLLLSIDVNGDAWVGPECIKKLKAALDA